MGSAAPGEADTCSVQRGGLEEAGCPEGFVPRPPRPSPTPRPSSAPPRGWVGVGSGRWRRPRGRPARAAGRDGGPTGLELSPGNLMCWWEYVGSAWCGLEDRTAEGDVTERRCRGDMRTRRARTR